MTHPVKVLAICGGVGGAKLALGLQRVLPPGALAVLVNTGDDFEHLGLSISPDLDTVLYTLAGVVNPHTGWGRDAETWSFAEETARLGGPTWFRLGDRDLALHLERTRRLAGGETLSAITARLARAFNVATRILPMSDDPVRTRLDTARGELEFQHYFVRERCEPVVRAVHYSGAATAQASPAALELLQSAALEAVVICPSNPYLSIDPILALPALRAALCATAAPVVAVTPLLGAAAVKGPTAKLMQELGIEVAARAVLRHYAGLIDGFVFDAIDAGDAAAAHEAGRTGTAAVRTMVAATLMTSLQDRERLARDVLQFASAPGAERQVRRAS